MRLTMYKLGMPQNAVGALKGQEGREDCRPTGARAAGHSTGESRVGGPSKARCCEKLTRKVSLSRDGQWLLC